MSSPRLGADRQPQTRLQTNNERTEAAARKGNGTTMASIYVLTFLVVLLVIYLFYAVINPQKF